MFNSENRNFLYHFYFCPKFSISCFNLISICITRANPFFLSGEMVTPSLTCTDSTLFPILWYMKFSISCFLRQNTIYLHSNMKYPSTMTEWHIQKNGAATPFPFSYMSTKKSHTKFMSVNI